MDAAGIFKAVFALAVVLGLILALAYGLRRYAPNLLARVASPRGRKRLEILETLVLDPTRRVVIVRVDEEERLILLGEGHELIEPRPHAELKPKATQPAAETPTAPRPRPVAVASAPKSQAPSPTARPQAAPSGARASAARTADARPAVQDPNDDLF
jgi:flagellar protein FliO/FliZ